MKFIVIISNESKDLVRKVVVVNGRAYFQSTGGNSKMPGVWLPFSACKGLQPIIIRSQDGQKYKRESMIGAYGAKHGVLIKNTANDVNLTGSDESEWCSLSLRLKQKDEKEAKDLQINKIFDRLYLKVDLLNSLRLTEAKNYEVETDVIIQKAGLSDLQRQLAFTKLQLDEKPDFESNDPDQVNTWLIQQGVQLASYPSSYQKIWDAAGRSVRISESLLDSDFASDQERVKVLLARRELMQVRALLLDYTGNNSAIKRFFTFHWDRHHIQIVTDALNNRQLNTPTKLIAHIRYTIGENLDPDGSLASRLDFIEQYTLDTDSKKGEALLLHWEWQKAHCQRTGLEEYQEYDSFIKFGN